MLPLLIGEKSGKHVDIRKGLRIWS